MIRPLPLLLTVTLTYAGLTIWTPSAQADEPYVDHDDENEAEVQDDNDD